MGKDHWVRKVIVTSADLEEGDWGSRDRNPIAVAIQRVLRPGVTVFVDLRQEEFFLGYKTHNEWYLLPDPVLAGIDRVYHGEDVDELTFEMTFPSWALMTDRSLKKQQKKS